MFTSADPPLVPQYSFASPGVEVRRSRAESGGSEYFRAQSVSRQRLALQGRGAARAHLANVRGNRRTGQDQLALSRPRRPHQRSRFELVGARRRRALRALSGSRRYPALLRRKALVSAGVSACECAAQNSRAKENGDARVASSYCLSYRSSRSSSSLCRTWPRISPGVDRTVCTFTYAAPLRSASTTLAKSAPGVMP